MKPEQGHITGGPSQDQQPQSSSSRILSVQCRSGLCPLAPPTECVQRRGCSQDDPPRTTLPALVLSHSFCSCLACGPGVVRGSVPSVCPEVMLCWAGCLAPGSLEVPGHCEVPRTLTLPKVTSNIHTCGADRQLPLTRRAGDVPPTLLASEALAVRGPGSPWLCVSRQPRAILYL